METFTSFDGTPIAFREWGAEYGTVPVVLHHGFAADSLTNWVTPGVADRIVATGRRVVALDARGHGKSGKPHDVAAYARRTDGPRRVSADRPPPCSTGSTSSATRWAATSRWTWPCNEPRLRSVVIGGIGGATLDPQSDRPFGDASTRCGPPAIDDVADTAGRQFRRLARAVRRRPRRRSPRSPPTTATAATAWSASPSRCWCSSAPTTRWREGSERLAAAIPGARHQVVPGDHLACVAEPAFAQAIIEFLSEHR